jgi:hypothetical protein
MKSHQDNYQKLLDRYRRQISIVRQLSRRTETNLNLANRLFIADEKRNAIHQELKNAGILLGKTVGDVNIDILLLDDDLREYGLPEFKMIHLKTLAETALKKMIVRKVDFANDGLMNLVGEEIPDSDKLFIPFVNEESWHLYDYDQSFDKEPTALERRRRLKRLASDSKDVTMAQVELPETFHRHQQLIGALMNVANYEKVLNKIFTKRKEMSIAPRFMNETQIAKDWEHIVRDKIKEIFAYDLSTNESYEYLLRRYQDYCKDQKLNPEQLTTVNELIDQTIENYKEQKESTENKKYAEHDILPKQEGMRRRFK